MRREGPDMLDPDPRAVTRAPPDLGRMAAVDFAAGFRRGKAMRPAIGVEAHRQAMLRKDLVQRPEGRGRAFLLDEKGRIDRPVASSSVTMRSRAGWPSSHSCREPSPPSWGQALMQHHARQRPPLALAPMRPLARRLRRDPAHCRCSLSQVEPQPKPWSFTRCSWKCLTVKPW